MLTEVTKEINNFFEDGYIDADFSIADDGTITPSAGILPGQYICITGSTFHDGVFRVLDGKLQIKQSGNTDPAETFTGRVWTLHPPGSFLHICEMIEAYQRASEKSVGPYTSESFGGYSYTKATTSTGGIATWQEAFACQLAKWRHMFTEVDL